MSKPAQARQWVVFFENSTRTAQLDVDSIKGQGSIRDFWVRSTYSEQTSGFVRHSSSLTKEWVNCSTRKIGRTEFILYDSKGNPVFSSKDIAEPDSWSSVYPDTLGEAMLENVCKLRTRENDRQLQPASRSLKMVSTQEATNLIKQWLKSKKRIFAPPYDLKLVSDITTGKLYRDLSSENGPVSWLRNNSSYYQYESQSVESIQSIDADNTQLVISAYILESSTLIKNQAIVKESTGVNKVLVRYEFIKVGGRWRLEDYKNLDN